MKNSNYTDAKIAKVIKQYVRDENIKQAIHGAPVYTLEEMLDLKGITNLRLLGKILRIKGYTKLDKSSLVVKLLYQLPAPNFLLTVFRVLPAAEWNFFCSVAAHRSLATEKVLAEVYFRLVELGLMQIFFHKSKIIFVVPKEIREAFSYIADTDFITEKQHALLLDEYAAAAVSLYGVIRLSDFVEIFNTQNERQIDVKEVKDTLSFYAQQEGGYLFWQEYLVEANFAEDDFEAVPLLINEIGRKPRYLPERKEFLKYANFDYFEITPQYITLQKHVRSLVKDQDTVYQILDEFNELCLAEALPDQFFRVLFSHGVNFKSNQEANIMAQLIMEVSNHTRLWQNNGHTPDELYKRKPGKILTFPGMKATAAVLTGRNDPCPCGSGKKYKNCCGKDK